LSQHTVHIPEIKGNIALSLVSDTYKRTTLDPSLQPRIDFQEKKRTALAMRKGEDGVKRRSAVKLFNTPTSFLFHVRWVPCHHGMARPQVADGVDSLWIWRVAANILNKQSRTADKGL
jgi:hypothetical protein